MKFQCDVHPWMFAWVSLFDSPYFAVSGPDGKFAHKNVPAGKYTAMVATYCKLGEQTCKSLTLLTAVRPQTLTFEVK